MRGGIALPPDRASRSELGVQIQSQCVNVMTDGSVIAPITRSMIGGGSEKPEVTIPYYENLED